MSATSSVSDASSAALATQVSTTVAKKVQDAQKQEGAQVVAMISSAKAISDLNTANAAATSESAVDIYG